MNRKLSVGPQLVPRTLNIKTKRDECDSSIADLVYADDICLIAVSPAHLQALMDALGAFCGTLHMEISVAKD